MSCSNIACIRRVHIAITMALGLQRPWRPLRRPCSQGVSHVMGILQSQVGVGPDRQAMAMNLFPTGRNHLLSAKLARTRAQVGLWSQVLLGGEGQSTQMLRGAPTLVRFLWGMAGRARMWRENMVSAGESQAAA